MRRWIAPVPHSYRPQHLGTFEDERTAVGGVLRFQEKFGDLADNFSNVEIEISKKMVLETNST